MQSDYDVTMLRIDATVAPKYIDVKCFYFFTLPYLRDGWVLATQRCGHKRIGPMRIPEIAARLREPLRGSDEPHKSMWPVSYTHLTLPTILRV